jgi:hypothetical protein
MKIVGEKLNNQQIGRVQTPDWWAAVPADEQRLLAEIMRMVRGLKRSQVPQVSQAARSWEHALGFFIKVRLINRKRSRIGRKWQTRHVAETHTTALISYPSASRNQ